MSTELPKSLIDDFANDMGSVFVGAGVSAGAGLPTWKSLLEEIRKPLPADMSYLDIAQHYETELTKPKFQDRVWLILQKRREPTKVHEDIVQLPIRRVFTTNLDTLLETAALRHNRTPKKITNTDQSIAVDPNHLCIFKLHGDLDQRTSYVLTADDYERFANDYPLSVLSVSYELHTSTVLFVGYSFNDVDLRMILTEVSKQAGPYRRRHFALITNPSPQVIAELDRRSIQVIPIRCEDGQRTDALHDWFVHFSREVAGEKKRKLSHTDNYSSAITALTFRPPAPAYKRLIGREQDIQRLRKAVLSNPRGIVAVEGFPGCGKSSLTLEVICGLENQGGTSTPKSFDEVIWVNLSASTQKHSFEAVMDAISTLSRTSTQDRSDIPDLPDSKRVLLVLDNFDAPVETELCDLLNRMADRIMILITTRELPALRNVQVIRIEDLDTRAAIDFVNEHAPEFSGDIRSVDKLVRITSNPQTLLLLLGIARTSGNPISTIVADGSATQYIRESMAQLFASSWQFLDQDGRQVVCCLPLFSSIPSINPKALSATTGLAAKAFEVAAEKLVHANLLSRTGSGRLIAHPLMQVFAQSKWEELSPDQQEQIRMRELAYYINFLREHAVRNDRALILPPYWNALVCRGMERIDPEWHSVENLLLWLEGQDRLEAIFDIVMLTAHYLDSRFLNEGRRQYVAKAIEYTVKSQRKVDEALLRIDALGWTYIEEGQREKARKEIRKGLNIAKALDKTDLKALAYSWLARMYTQSDVAGQTMADGLNKATRYIQKALGLETSPWIRYRVNFAAGDLEYNQGHYDKALQFYQTGANQVSLYGGEEGYQIETRLGLAWVGLGDLDEAERNFNRISGLAQIPIGQVHAIYGLALVARKRGNLEKEQQLLKTITLKAEATQLVRMTKQLW